MDREDKKNLRGTDDQLVYYRLKETGTVQERTKFIDLYNESNKKVYFYPEKDKLIFKEEDIRTFSLDQYGENIPYIDGEMIIFNNYLYDFWGHYLSAESLSLYGHLKRYAYGSKDFCYPNFELICAKMDKSRKTVHSYLDILEHFGFAIKYGVLNGSRNMLEESPLFKVRKKVPLLSKKLIYGDPDLVIPDDAPAHIKKVLKKQQKGLPPLLIKEHEKFEEKFLQDQSTSLSEEQVNYEDIYKAWSKAGDILKKLKPANPKLLPKTTAQLIMDMNEEEKNLLAAILKVAEQKISKPSFETWFKELIIKKMDASSYTIYAPNEFAKDWLEQRYTNFLLECLNNKDENITSLSFKHTEET